MSNESLNTVEKLSKDLQKYVELRLQYQKLNSIEKASSSASFAVYAIVLSLILFFSFLFLNIFIAVCIAYYTTPPIGFGIFLMLYLITIIFLLIFRKSFQRFVNNRLLAIVLDNLDQDEEEED